VAQAVARHKRDTGDQDLRAALPLYAASLAVTLAGIGAVGVTISETAWTPVWALLALLGHGVSLMLRRMRVPSESVFYPVMLLGSAFVLQQTVIGSSLVGMNAGLGSMPVDMATAVVVGALAVVRTFTLLTNASLLFSPVPGITMLALTGSSNPNAEIPLFFVILLLGSLFIVGYEAQVRRVSRISGQSGPVLFHLLSSWCLTLIVAGAALLFPMVVQPLIGPFSPFALPSMGRLRAALNFTNLSSTQAPVGQGPITLSPTPVYEVHTPEGGLLRTGVFVNYTGSGWVQETPPDMALVYSDQEVQGSAPRGSGGIAFHLYEYAFPPDPDLEHPLPVREVHQRLVTKAYSPPGIPALGRISQLRYPRPSVYVHGSGCVSGRMHTSPGREVELVSRVTEYPPDRLRQASPVDRESFSQKETLSVPNSAMPVHMLAREITQEIPNNYDRIQAIIRHIEKTCRYTLQEERTPPGEDAAAYYLLTTKRGACDLAATAAAVMCRSVGIPARVAVGYVAEEPLPGGGGFLIRQEHAHMWLEAFFPGYGWVPFNPAPPLASIRDHPLEAAWYRVQGLFSKIGGGGLDALLLTAIVLATLALAAYTAWTHVRRWLQEREREQRILKSSPAAVVALLYGRALRLLDRRGWPREGWLTAREYAASLRGRWEAGGEAMRALQTLTECFERAHYAGEASPEDVETANLALEQLSRLAPRRPRERGTRREHAPARL
jgi:transglutaminase-like putative cysteine protease